MAAAELAVDREVAVGLHEIAQRLFGHCPQGCEEAILIAGAAVVHDAALFKTHALLMEQAEEKVPDRKAWIDQLGRGERGKEGLGFAPVFTGVAAVLIAGNPLDHHAAAGPAASSEGLDLQANA